MNASDPIPVDAASVAAYKARFWKQNPRPVEEQGDDNIPACFWERTRPPRRLLLEAQPQKWQATR